MADSENLDPSSGQASERSDRKFSVSSNRGKASHKLRYVEVGGAAVDTEDCTFCQPIPEPTSNEKEETPKSS